MTEAPENSAATSRILLCFDGSEDAVNAISVAARQLGARSATLLTIWEPAATWAPYDPATALTGGVSRLAAKELGLDDTARELAESTMARGEELAREAGFAVTGEIAKGKPWRAICDRAEETDVATIVLGARGLSRVQSLLLGSVSAAVLTHTRRPVLVVPAPHQSHHAGDRPRR